MTDPRDLPARWAERFAVAEPLTVSQWCDRNRTLNEEAAEPGSWSTARTPYLAEPLDAFADDSVDLIVMLKGSRVGGTEWVNGCLAWAAARDRPKSIVYMYPTQSDATEECENRLTPLFETCAPIADRFPHAGWKTKHTLEFRAGVFLYMAWAAAARTLLRRTAQITAADELENCVGAALAHKQGDAWALLRERSATFDQGAKALINTTPTTEDGTGYQEFLRTDQRSYHVPCPQCGFYQKLVFDRIRSACRDPDELEQGELARYVCIGCDAELDDATHKRWMITRGVWLPKAQEIVEPLPVGDAKIVERACFDSPNNWRPEISGEQPKTSRRGYHLSSLYAPWKRRSWSRVLAYFHRTSGRPRHRRVFVTQWLAEPWRDIAESVDRSSVHAARCDLARGVVPAAAQQLIATVDVQKGHIWFTVRAFAFGRVSSLIDYGHRQLSGFDATDESTDEDGANPFGVITVLEKLHAYFASKPYRREGTGAALSPRKMFVDTGWLSKRVRQFCMRYRHNRPATVAIKGVDDPTNDTWITRPASKATVDADGPLILVNVEAAKDELHAQISQDSPRIWTIFAGVGHDYFSQMISERKIRKPSGRFKWEPVRDGGANHLWDDEVYQVAGADFTGWLDKSGRVRKKDPDVSGRAQRGAGQISARDYLRSQGRRRR